MSYYMAIDQYGYAIHNLEFPRKDLMAHFGTQHADKMYTDMKDGSSNHIGYVIKGHWCTVYKVTRIDEDE